MGFTSLVYEVYSAKILFLYFVESTQAVAVTLSAFLAGLGVSALVCSRYATEDRRRAHAVLVGLQIAAAAYALLVLRHHEVIPAVADFARGTFGTGSASDACRIVFSWVYLFLPGLFIGGAFPILTGLYVSDLGEKTRDTGVVYFWDTLGAIVGAVVAGFLLLPWLGLRRTILVPAGLNLLIVSALVERRALRVAAAAAAVGCFGLAFTPGALPVSLLSRALPSGVAAGRSARRFGRIVAQEESPFGLVTVGDDAKDKVGNRGLFIGMRDMCHSLLNGSETLLATNTVAQLAAGARVLNIGLGCGFTAGAIAASPKVAALEIAEINPVVVKMARDRFGSYNGQVLGLKKTQLFIQDGAELLRDTPRTYDAVVIDIEEPTIVHSSVLYTREYFEIIREKLALTGVLALWMAGWEPDAGRIVRNTLRAVFTHVELRVAPTLPSFSFYASRRALDLPPLNSLDAEMTRDMEASRLDELNTVDNRALERHFDIRQTFALASEYDEPSFVDVERARAKSPGATPDAKPR